MLINWKKLLIFLIILLVCSITPAMAVQSGETDNTSNSYTYGRLYDDSRNILSELTEAEDVELTPEQSVYIEAHQGGLKTKAEAMLYNIQSYLNYLLQESARYENTSTTSNLDLYKPPLTK